MIFKLRTQGHRLNIRLDDNRLKRLPYAIYICRHLTVITRLTPIQNFVVGLANVSKSYGAFCIFCQVRVCLSVYNCHVISQIKIKQIVADL